MNGGPPSSRSIPKSPQKIYFRNALSSIQVPSKLLRGVQVLQVAANGSTKPCLMSLSEDKFTLTLVTEKKSATGFFRQQSMREERCIDISEMDRLQRGQSTLEFEKAKKAIKKPVTIRNVSSGSSSEGEVSPLLDPERSFSIIFRGAHTLDLMAASTSTRDDICSALDKLLAAYQRIKIRVALDVQLLRYVWLRDKKRLYATPQHIAAMLHEMNWGAFKLRQVNYHYDQFGRVVGLDRARRRRGLTFEQTATFLHKLKRDSSWMIKPVTVIWNELFGETMNNGKLRTTLSDKTFLERFLHAKQGQVQASLVDVRKIFRRLHDMETAYTTGEKVDWTRISKDQFEAFLFLADNDAFDPEKEKFDKADMDRPLCEYWINSSHNTYLIGDQYKSQSSVEMYSNALYRGARCLELDVWDGGKLGNELNPVVWHGHTMTTKIRFVDIIQTIKVFLVFHPDTFPIILSFENHCSIPYQQVMAETLVRILGDLLYVPTEASLYGPLPSPAQLRGQVVIKGRRPDGTEADAYDTDDESDEEGATSSAGFWTVEELEAREKVKEHGVAPELARLSLFHGVKFKDWNVSSSSWTYHMHSFSENKVRSKCRHKESYQWIMYNQTHMSRTYPAGSRVDSSNYNPLLAWSTGCQMAALNFQTPDSFLRLNDGRFRENGNCGYVLKPPSLMLKGDFDPVTGPVRLSIRVLSGNCLPKPNGLSEGNCIDPYVKVSVFDVKNEEREMITSYPTSTVPANGFCPIWSQEKFTFVIENWAVAMVQLTVFDKTKDEFIASSSIPIYCLRRGIRSLKLYDATNTRSGAFDFASLLLDVKIGQLIAEI